MSRFALVTFCVAASLPGSRAADANLKFGLTMATRAYTAVCWYEALKIFPETHTKDFNKCGGATSNLQNQVENPNPGNKAYFESDPNGETAYFGRYYLSQKTTEKLSNPNPYKSCEKYLKDLDGINADPPADEGDTLRDGGNKKYPYRAYSYCMMKTLRDTRGVAAIDAVKAERTNGKKHWMTTLLDRENEFRKRHGAEPLKLNSDLNVAAQKWAETNAKECKMYHSKNTDAIRQYNGGTTGESLSSSTSSDDEKEVAAYLAADGWYEEIKDYPYPGGYKGDGSDDTFQKIGHFTQSVWKGSQWVGYGYALNKDCPDTKRFVAARYFPAGNMKGEYNNNVGPPK